MKVKDLIKELQKFDENKEVLLLTDHVQTGEHARYVYAGIEFDGEVRHTDYVDDGDVEANEIYVIVGS